MCHYPVGSRTAEAEKVSRAPLRPSMVRTGVPSSLGFWASRGFPQLSKANKHYCHVGPIPPPFPKGTTCYASFGPDVQISLSAHPARNTTIIYLSFQPSSTCGSVKQLGDAVGDRELTEALLQSPASQQTGTQKGEGPSRQPFATGQPQAPFS